MEAIGFDLREEATLQALSQDVIKTSEIEGENGSVKAPRLNSCVILRFRKRNLFGELLSIIRECVGKSLWLRSALETVKKGATPAETVDDNQELVNGTKDSNLMLRGDGFRCGVIDIRGRMTSAMVAPRRYLNA